MRRFLVTCPSREIHDTENLELVDLDALQAATGKVRRIGWKRRPVPSEHRQIGGEHAHPRPSGRRWRAVGDRANLD
jgi:hypothetical protein